MRGVCRSPFAHTRIRSIDGAPVAALPGVTAVLTAAELDLDPIQELPILAPRPALPADTVRFVGEPVAVVLAETLEAAADAAQLVQVDWEPLPPVLDPADGEEVRADRIGIDGDALVGAEVVVRGRFVNQRLAPLPGDERDSRRARSRYRGDQGLGLDSGALWAARSCGRPPGPAEG